MKVARMLSLAFLALGCFIPSTAHAWLDPYVRVGLGGHQAKMADANAAIDASVSPAQAAGLPVSPRSVGPGYGPSVSAGLWLVPGLRVGATYATQRSKVPNEYRQTDYLYQDDFQFDLEEYGIEAAVRIPRLAGFSFGGQVAQAKATFTEHFALENVHGNYYEDISAERRDHTYAVFMGFDQTTESGLAGFLQVGYHWRDMGALPGVDVINDNGTITRVPGESVPMDYSGWSVRLGAGWDLNW